MSLARTLADPELVRISRSLVANPGSPGEHDPDARPAAVALVLRAVEMQGLELLFIRRAEYADDPWSGQVAFPGGRHEAGDESLERTAIRETWEETGIDLSASGAMLGALDDVQPNTAVLPRVVVRPFVAAVSSDAGIRESGEVAEAFWVPVDALREESGWGETEVTAGGIARRVRAFQHGDHTVWGMTERVVRQLLARL
ncbi:MAG TPA: CoA pyrophosphatase [Gemmatimonadaceae bacterium]|nr:CoA pyrophosphatase [Gemmatimonadaceae bacterium]